MARFNDAEIVASWSRNAQPWTKAIREKTIPSRERVTNQAIVDAVLETSPKSIIDIGCGEGWLCRALAAMSVYTIGVDAIPELIEQARAAHAGDYQVISYEEIASGALGATADAAICNFSLLGESATLNVLAEISSGAVATTLIIQTLHPVVACGNRPYVDGWREGSWKGFSSDFRDPAPWFFRTIEGWLRLLAETGWQLIELREPIDPETLRPASIIFIARKR
ncbi:MAG: methyltransferase domain-containing protein [Dokdonella sp.]